MSVYKYDVKLCAISGEDFAELMDKGVSPEDIYAAVKTIERTNYVKRLRGVVEPVKTHDHPPCQDCGGVTFLRTGTCHVCQTCGASQGCS